jgi:hypothetical protein
MRLLLGGFVARLSTGDLTADVREGREWLVRITNQDFGYDAIRWHEYLWETDAGGYKWCRRSAESWARVVRERMSRPGWAEAVRLLEAEATTESRRDPEG